MMPSANGSQSEGLATIEANGGSFVGRAVYAVVMIRGPQRMPLFLSITPGSAVVFAAEER
jgi:hypothetical protein